MLTPQRRAELEKLLKQLYDMWTDRILGDDREWV